MIFAKGVNILSKSISESSPEAVGRPSHTVPPQKAQESVGEADGRMSE